MLIKDILGAKALTWNTFNLDIYGQSDSPPKFFRWIHTDSNEQILSTEKTLHFRHRFLMFYLKNAWLLDGPFMPPELDKVKPKPFSSLSFIISFMVVNILILINIWKKIPTTIYVQKSTNSVNDFEI